MSANIAIVRGTCSSPADVRELPSGGTVVNLQVTTRDGEAEPAISVPVVCFDPPAMVFDLQEGDEVVAFGRVRRRFFRAGGATASRVEVEATSVARARDRRRTDAILRKAEAALGEMAEF
jgi:single-strand DNA-binding protein